MRKYVAGAIATTLALVFASAAAATTTASDSHFTGATKADQSAGLDVNLIASDPLNVATEVDLIIPGKINGKAAPVCSVSDADLQSAPTTRCAANTQIGSGSAVAVAQPIVPMTTETVTAYNANDKRIALIFTGLQTFALTAVESGAAAFSTGHSAAAPVVTLATKVPVFPIPGGQAILTQFHLTTSKIGKPGKGKGAFFTTGKCPKSKKWAITAKVTYNNGTQSTSVSTTPCKKG